MGYLPPETVAGFVPEVCLRGEGRGAEALKPDRAWGEAMPVSEKYFALGPRGVRGEQPRCATVGIGGWTGGGARPIAKGVKPVALLVLFLIPWRAEKSGGCAEGVAVRVLGVWELISPVRLLFVADHGEHEGYGAVDAPDTAVVARVVGAGGNLIDAEAVVEGEGKFGAKPESVCRRVGIRGIPREGYIGRQCQTCRRW